MCRAFILGLTAVNVINCVHPYQAQKWTRFWILFHLYFCQSTLKYLKRTTYHEFHYLRAVGVYFALSVSSWHSKTVLHPYRSTRLPLWDRESQRILQRWLCPNIPIDTIPGTCRCLRLWTARFLTWDSVQSQAAARLESWQGCSRSWFRLHRRPLWQRFPASCTVEGECLPILHLVQQWYICQSIA